MRCWKKTLSILLFVGLVAFWSGPQANAASLQFYQLDFNLDGNITDDSDWGVAELTFTGSTNILYFNVVVNGSWEVQDVPVLSVEGSGVSQTQRFWFDLGNTVGVDVTSLNYLYQITTSPLLSAPTGTSTTASVADDPYVIANSGAAPGFPTVPSSITMVGGEAADPVQHTNEDFENQQAGPYECAPTAVSNSLKFLKKKHPKAMAGVEDGDITIEKMKGACGFVHNWGCPRDTWWSLKDNYMKNEKLPVTTRKFNATDIDKIGGEIDRNQDIEMEIHGHTVAVVGIKKLKTGNYEVTISHDKDQTDDGTGPGDGGLEVGPSEYNPTTGKWESGCLKDYAGINYFVVECPKPPPPGNYVGGIVTPVNKLALLAPYISLALTCVMVTAIYVKRRKKKQN